MKTLAPKQGSQQQVQSLPVQPGTMSAPKTSLPLRRPQSTIGNQAALRYLRANTRSEATVNPVPRPSLVRSLTPARPTSHPYVQTKLTINRPGDVYEQEADNVAGQIMRMTEPRLHRARACGDTCDDSQKKDESESPWHLQPKTIPYISRHTGQSPSATPSEAPASVHEILRSPGQPLDANTRAFMESRFGRDFSTVRLHLDSDAQGSAREIHANAYTIGKDVVFGANQFEPGTQSGKRLIAHELAHVIQQSAPLSRSNAESVTKTCSAPSVQRDPNDESQEPWSTLSPPIRQEAENLLHDYDRLMGSLAKAQMEHGNPLRGEWVNALFSIQGKILGLDSDSRLDDVENEFENLSATIDETVRKSRAGWTTLEKRYLDEDRYLRSIKSTDSDEAANYIEEIYQRTKRAVGAYVTEDDYLSLKFTLDNDMHIWLGALRGARIRVADLKKMMGTAAELRRHDEDADKILPGWRARVQDETSHLEKLIANAEASAHVQKIESRKQGLFEDERYFSELHEELVSKQIETSKVEPEKKSILEKGYDFVAGGIEAITGPLIEAANEAVDLLKIAGHFASFGKYEPKLTSDMAKAAEQGAGTGDILLGMVTGIVETPSRFLDACEKGDWENIGKETVNLLMLAKTIKEAPENLKKVRDVAKKLPQLLEKIRQSLRVLRARRIALGLGEETRLVPGPRTPGTPAVTDATAPRPVPADPQRPAATTQDRSAPKPEPHQIGADKEASVSRRTPRGPSPKDLAFKAGKVPVPEVPNRVYRIMSMNEGSQALKTHRLPPPVAGAEGSRFVSLDSKYAMLFREKTLASLTRLGEGISKLEENLGSVEKRIAEIEKTGGDSTKLRRQADNLRSQIEEKGVANRAVADPAIKEWYEAPGQKVVVEIELEPGYMDEMLRRCVESDAFKNYQGDDVYLWKLERGYGRNVGIPSWQLELFNSKIKRIRFFAERGAQMVGRQKLPVGPN